MLAFLSSASFSEDHPVFDEITEIIFTEAALEVSVTPYWH